MNDINAFKLLLKSLEIHTRLAPSALEVNISKLTKDNKEAYLKEFNDLSQSSQSPVEQWLKKLKSKNKAQETDEILLELLVELYRKVDSIEQLLQSKNYAFLPLEKSENLAFIGHSVLCMAKECFEIGEKYYLRLFLPIFPARHIGIFGIAPHAQVLQITKIHHNDMSDFDSFVVQQERMMILESKQMQKE